MADIGKNGYNWTGYTEPFITTEAIAGGAALKKVGGYLNNDDTPVAIGIDGAVPIENTEFKNAGLFLTAQTIVDGTTITTKCINFDTRMEKTITPNAYGIFIIRDDNLDYQAVTDVTYSVSTGLYTVTVDDTTNMTAGKNYAVAARVPDHGAASTAAGETFAAGDVVKVIYP